MQERWARRLADEAAALIDEAMNPDEGAWARVTIGRHFEMRANGLADGRNYFALLVDGALAGQPGCITTNGGRTKTSGSAGLPFHRSCRVAVSGVRLMAETEQAAQSLGYRKLFIETYATPTFSRAIRFYAKAGFRKAGMIENYLPDGSAMLVFLKEL